MDITLTINYEGQKIAGRLLVSNQELPHFYWCFIDEPELVAHLGDCIGFKDNGDGVLMPTESYSRQYEKLVMAFRQEIERIMNIKGRAHSFPSWIFCFTPKTFTDNSNALPLIDTPSRREKNLYLYKHILLPVSAKKGPDFNRACTGISKQQE